MMEQGTNANLQFNNNEISIVAATLGIYFMMMPFDSIPVFGMGSLLRVFVLFPFGAIIAVKFKHSVQINRLTVSYFIYCLMLTVSCFYSINPTASFNNLKRVLLNMVIVLCIGGMYEYNEDEIEFLKRSLVVGGLGTLALTLLFADTSSDGRLTLSINGNKQDQNYLNGYLFFAYVYFLIGFVKGKKIWSIVPVAGILYFTLLTGSRGALVALAGITAVTVVLILFRDNNLKLSTVALILAAILLFIILYKPVLSLLPESVSERFSVEYIAEHGNTGRSEIWRHLIGKFKNAGLFRTLFGHGYATVVYVNEYNHLVAHNLWLDHLIMVGIVGELIFVFMQCIYVMAAWKSDDPFILGVYVGYLIMMMTLSLLSYKPIWNCMMMIMIIKKKKKRQFNHSIEEGAHGL